MSAFLEIIKFNNQAIYNLKLNFSKPTWVHKTVRFVRTQYARGGASIESFSPTIQTLLPYEIRFCTEPISERLFIHAETLSSATYPNIV